VAPTDATVLLVLVLYTELPKYNEKRRGTISMATIRNLQRSRSNPQLHRLFSQDGNYAASLSSAGGYQVLNNGFLFDGAKHQGDPAQGHAPPPTAGQLIHSFSPVISIAPLLVHCYSEVLPNTTLIYCVRVNTPKRYMQLRVKTCPKSLRDGKSGIRTCDPMDPGLRTYD